MIKTQVIGHIGNDAIVKEVNGVKVINFSVAHTESYKNKEGVKMENTTWVECAHWTERTAVAQYLKKGTLVYVDGQPSVDSYTDKHGREIPKLRLRVGNIQLLGSAKPADGSPVVGNHTTPAPVTPAPPDSTNEGVDDLPF